MKKIEYIFLPSRTYRGEIEFQLDACNSLEEAQDLVVEKAGELYDECTPEEMRAVIDQGQKENVYSMSHMFKKPEDDPDTFLYYPDGNGNWPVQILRVKLAAPLYLK